MDVASKLQALHPTISKLLELSGAPGLSLGVLHHGSVIHTSHFGRKNVDYTAPPDDHTIYHIASLVKLLTAGVVASLVHDGKIDWDTPIRNYLPEFSKRQDVIGKEANVRDLLSMRSGLPVSNASFAHQRAETLIPRSETLRTAAFLEPVTPFREAFVYSQWNYSLLTDLVEEVTGQTYETFVRERFLRRLGMTRTHFGPHGDDENDAKAHAIRNDFSACTILSPGTTDATGLAGAMGGKSSIHDLLIMYQSFLAAHTHQKTNNVDSTPGSPWKYARQILEPHVPVGKDMEKLGYCLGLYRVTLPAVLSISSMNQQLFRAAQYPIPEFGSKKNKGRKLWFHTAGMPGFHGSMFMDPSTQSAIIVMENALPVVDSSDFSAQLALSVLLGETPQEEEFEKMTEMARPFQLMGYERLAAALEEKRTEVPPSLPLSSYQGDYYNAIGNIVNTITAVDDEYLLMTHGGTGRTSWKLFPYDGDTFYWKVDREWELCEKGMWPFLTPEWHKLHFKVKETLVESFTWHHDPLAKPEVFRNKAVAARLKIWSRI
ncbi:beta-lactamase/transpeptidase-like protein [Periconia macrospinosa]|uniref:Beta-lactamase/transpeptidase-like protein n=1 Tax=Periconia macrospinosa TaxID=97972 RepID=A0A2V1D804_9PLEO|nr:beta-lactamase/transpeptidase-like protein [Periconia macrospinosa]